MVRRNENELTFLSISPDALYFHRQLAESLRVRAMNKLGENKNAEAWEDINAALRLERLVFILWDLHKIEGIIRKRTDSIEQGNIETDISENDFSVFFANRSGLLETLTKHPTWKKEELDRCIADLETLPTWMERLTYLKMLQYTVLDVISSMNDVTAFSNSLALDGQPKDELSRAIMMPFMNWGILAKQVNIKFADHEKNIKPEDTQTLAVKTDKEIIKELHRKISTAAGKSFGRPLSLITVNGRSVLIGDALGDVLTASDIIVFKQELNSEAERQLLRAAFAVKRFQLEKNELPKTLEELQLKPLVPELPLKLETTAEGISLTCGSQGISLKN